MEANLRQYAQYIPRISAVESLPYFQSKTRHQQDLLQALKEEPSTSESIAAIIVELLELKILLKGGTDHWTKKEWGSYFYSYLPSCYTSYQLSTILPELTPLPQNLVVALVWFYEEEYWSKLPIPTETKTEESKHMSLREKINSDILTYSEKCSLLTHLSKFDEDKYGSIGFCLIDGIFYPANNFTIDKDRLTQKIKIPKIGTRTLKTILDAFECKYTIVVNQKEPILIIDDSNTMQDLPLSDIQLPSQAKLQTDYEDRIRFCSRKCRLSKNNPEWHKMLQAYTAKERKRRGVPDSEYHAVTSISNWEVELNESSHRNSKLTYTGPPTDRLTELVNLFSKLNLYYVDAIRSRKINNHGKITSSVTYEPEILSKIIRDLADIPLDFSAVNHPPQPYKFVTKNSSSLDELVKSVKEIKTHV